MRPSEQTFPESSRPDLAETPICDRLLALGRRNVVSFHALPLSNRRSLQSSGLRDKYERIFGREVLRHDLTYTGQSFDTPVVPRRCVEKSRQLTARAFGARYSCYVTTGTTMSNWIAVFALAGPEQPVLVDRLCHQSVHLALAKNRSQKPEPGDFRPRPPARRAFGTGRAGCRWLPRRLPRCPRGRPAIPARDPQRVFL
jgi:hypothetical protein